MAKLTPAEREELKQKLDQIKSTLDWLKKQPRTADNRRLIEQANALIVDISKTLGRHR